MLPESARKLFLKAIATAKNLQKVCQPVIIGDLSFLRKTAKKLELDIEFIETKE